MFKYQSGQWSLTPMYYEYIREMKRDLFFTDDRAAMIKFIIALHLYRTTYPMHFSWYRDDQDDVTLLNFIYDCEA